MSMSPPFKPLMDAVDAANAAIKKYNESHDERGRFASGNDGGGVDGDGVVGRAVGPYGGYESGVVRAIPISAINEGEQAFSDVDKKTVREYTRQIKVGKQIAPIELVQAKADGRFRIQDGYHRFAAYKAAGRTEILARLWTGSEEAWPSEKWEK